MNIGLCLLRFKPGGMGGTETYFKNLLNSLQIVDDENAYTLICDEKSVDAFRVTSSSFKTKLLVEKKGSPKRLARRLLKNVFSVDLFELPIGRLEMDLIHYPFTVMRPAVSHIPTVLTFHDMQQEYYPAFFSHKELENRRRTYKKSAQTATRVIAISEYTKRTLVERYTIPPEKIDVISLGCGEEFRRIGDAESLSAMKGKYALDKPFIYYPAAFWPHKNHRNLLAAFRILRDRFFLKGDLVLSGIPFGSYDEIQREVDRLKLRGSVRFLGYLPHEDLPLIYNLADVMAFPSLFEGFGIPLLEAMACGCPVVCSDATSIPEVVGDAGVLFDPESPEDMAEKLSSVWYDEEKKRGMRLAGHERVKMFNWHDSARKTVAVFEKAFHG